MGKKAIITSLEFPTSAVVGMRMPVKITGRVTDNDDERTAFFVMFYYIDGPAGSVETSCGEMPVCRHRVCITCGKFTERGVPVGTEFTYEGWVKYPAPGQYKFRVVAGWFIDPIAYDFTDRRDVHVSVSPPPTPSPALPPAIDALLVVAAGASAFLSSFINTYLRLRRRR
ncbi:MAG: hypothetical protein ACO2PN_29295 [Pyrobaculum sp.]|jgi:hypothetical protein